MNAESDRMLLLVFSNPNDKSFNSWKLKENFCILDGNFIELILIYDSINENDDDYRKTREVSINFI